MKKKKLLAALLLCTFAILPASAARIEDQSLISGEIISGESYNGSGGAVYNTITSTIENSTLSNNTAAVHGGAVYNAGTLTITDGSADAYTSFSGNSAHAGGAVSSLGGTLNIGNYTTFDQNNTFDNNTSAAQGDAGGALYVSDGTLNIGDNVSFTNNTALSAQDSVTGAKGAAGAIYVYNSDVTIGDNLEVSDNESQFAGGGVYIWNNDGTSTAAIGSDAVFENNESKQAYGGAIGNFDGSLEIGENAKFEGNSAATQGGAIANKNFSTDNVSLTIAYGANFTNNSAGTQGGALYNEGHAELTGATFTGNSAQEGGAVYNTADGVLSLENVEFKVGTDSAANDIYNSGEITTSGTNTFASNITNLNKITFGGTDYITGNITGEGQIALNAGSNSGTIDQDIVEITGSETFTNTSTGSIFANSINNGEDATFINEGSIGSDVEGSENTPKITNSGTFSNSGSIVAGAIENKGIFSNAADKTISAEEIINNKGAEFTNNGTIESDINNDGTFNNNGLITADKLVNKENASISGDSGSLVITGADSSNAGEITQDNITLGTSGAGKEFENTGTITSKGEFTNYDSITGEGSLNINDGTSEGTISQKDVSVSGKFNNNANLTTTTDGTLKVTSTGEIVNKHDTTITTDNINIENGGKISGDGNITINGGTNAGEISQKNITLTNSLQNDGTLTSTNSFSNSGTLTRSAAGSGILNIKDGSNTGSITQAEINVDGTFTNETTGSVIADAITNNSTIVNLNTIQTGDLTNIAGAVIENKESGTIEISGNMDNKGTINNWGSFNSASNSGTLNNEGTFISSGTQATMNFDKVNNVNENSVFAASNGANLDIKSIENNGTIQITDSSKLNITEQAGELGGVIEVLRGENELSVAGSTNDLTATLNIGNSVDNSTLILNQNNIVSEAIVNLTQRGRLQFDNANATVVLDSNDKIEGDIIMKNGTLNMDNITLTTGNVSTQDGGTLAYYEQDGGNLNIVNGSKLTMGDSSKILSGTMTVDDTSAYISASNGFNLNTLNGSGLIGAMNSQREDYFVNDMLIGNTTTGDNQLDLTIDVYGRSNASHQHGTDRFITDNITTNLSSAVVNISDWGLTGDIFGWDAPIDRDITLQNVFSGNISENIELSATRKEVFTPIGWYQLNNHGGIGGTYTLNLTRFNPQVYRGQVSTIAQVQNQLAIDDMLFNHSMLLPSFKENDETNQSGIHSNRYAAIEPVFAPYQYSRKDGGLWYKMYGIFETLQMSQGLGHVGNNAYGALIGADFGLKELRNGWKFMPTAYIGYNGAHQYWAGTGAYQNGGQAGFLGTWYKNNFILGGLLYGGVYDNSMNIAGHNDSTFNYFGGAATKAAYNWRLHRDWVLQPNLFLAYNYFGQQNWHSDFGQMGMMSGMLNGVNLAPGLNLIWEKETFSIYATLQYMYNLNGAVGGRAGNVTLPHIYMERGYIQYGLGVTKKLTDRCSGYFQTVFRNVGRTGVGFQLGFNILLGK